MTFRNRFQRLLFPLALLLGLSLNSRAQSTVTVSGHISTVFGTAIPGGTAANGYRVCFGLRDGNSQVIPNPRIAGGGGTLISANNSGSNCVQPDSSGFFTTALVPNDLIESGGVTGGSQWMVVFQKGNNFITGSNYVFALADGTENLDTKLPNTVIPIVPAPTGDSIYSRLDGTNQPFTAPISTPGYQVAGAALNGRFLKGNGISFVSSTGSASGIGTQTCTNQFLRSLTLNSDAAPTSTCSSVNFATDGTGVVPTTNGGTGQNSTATFPSSGVIESGTGTTNTIPKFTNGASGVQGNSSITDDGTQVSTSEPVTNTRIRKRATALTSSTTLTANGDTTDIATMAMTGTAGTLTIAAPTGTPTDGQQLIIRITATNAQTYSFNAIFHFSTTTVAPTSIAAGKTDYIGCMWNATNSAWDVVALDQGH